MDRSLQIDHTAGGRRRETALVDQEGRVVLRVKGDWAILDDEGRWTLYWVPDQLGAAKAGAIDGLISGLLGIGSGPNPGTLGRNAGPGRQAIQRPERPLRGMSLRGAPVIATVVREPVAAGSGPGEYRVDAPAVGGDRQLDGLRFVPVPDAAATPGTTGFADPRYATYELRRADGRPVIRHRARIARDLSLRTSVFDVLDPEFPLDEAVALSLARFHAWRA